MAGEWELIGDNAEHDGLRQLFLFFVDNRDVSDDGKNGGMKVNENERELVILTRLLALMHEISPRHVLDTTRH